MRRLSLIALVLCALVVSGSARADAQDSTPAAGTAPDPSECDVEPASPDSLIALWYPPNENGTPAPVAPDSSASPGATDSLLVDGIPVGEPADADTAELVEATAYLVFACFNAGDFLRAFSLYSDDLTRASGPGPGTTVDDARGFLAVEPVPKPAAEWQALIEVTNITLMADGRVGAVVVSNNPSVAPGEQQTAVVIFIEEAGEIVIDEVVTEPVEATPVEEATPAP